MTRFNQWVAEVLLTGFAEPDLYEPRVTWIPAGEGFVAGFLLPGRINKTQAFAANAWRCAGLVRQGVRVYAPTRHESEALAEAEVNIPCSDYRQPFETMVVVLPDGFLPNPVSADVGRAFALLGRCATIDGRIMFSMGVLSDGPYRLSCDYFWATDQSVAIEDHCFLRAPSDNYAQGERDVLADCRRLFVNANLLLTQYGAKRLGAADPVAEAALLRELREGNRAARRKAERSLKEMPVVYGIEQDVRVYETEGSPAAAGEAGGWHVRPHWRRGHWAMVACGAGRKERRRVFRPAVMVHADRFGGAPSDTRAVYTTAGGAA